MSIVKFVVCDIDNCLSNDEWRIPLIAWHLPIEGGRYDTYHAMCGSDTVNLRLSPLLGKAQSQGCRIAYFTARPQSVRGKTLDWLKRHNCFAEDSLLFMRGNDDHRPSRQLKEAMLDSLLDPNHSWVEDGDEAVVAMAYDDRVDVVAMYASRRIPTELVRIHDTCAYKPPPPRETTAADVLSAMADTFRERNKVYGSNYLMVSKLVKVMFPDGVPPGLVETDHWHLFELKLVKLSRFAISGLTHIDSIHDDAVYAAMIEAILSNNATKDAP